MTMKRRSGAHDVDVTVDERAVAVSGAKTEAAGVPAVLVSLQRAMEQMGALRTAATWRKLNQRNGFDCPGCAWPEEHGGRKYFEFCENGAKAVAEEATTRRVTPEFFARHSMAELSAKPEYWLSQQGRLTHPMVLRAGDDHYRPIGWDDAYTLIADHLNALDTPDEALFYTSGRTSNEAAFVYQLLVRSFGTNNLPDCSNMCHESSGTALNESIGVGKGSVTVDDVEHADLIVIAGQNPGTNHPRMLSVLEKAKANGARIIAINPLPEAGLIRFKDPQKVHGVIGHGIEIADEFVQIRVGGDMALFAGLGRLLFEAEDRAPGTVVDRAFVDEHCAGFDDYRSRTRQIDIDTVLAATGIDRTQLDRVAAMVMASQRTIVCWAMGLTQHRHAVASIAEITNLLLLRGMIGKPGAGVCPVRGHSNVQGDRTMGIWEQMPESFLAALDRHFGIASPRKHGYDTVNAIRAMRDGHAKIFIGMGGNFASATPDTAVTEAALRRCALTVQISTKLNRSHLVHGATALILPTLGRTDRDIKGGRKQLVSVEDSMSMVHLSRGGLHPPSDQVRSEVAIVCELARTLLGAAHPVPWQTLAADYDAIRDAIAAVVPGCADYNRKVRAPDGFQLPHPPRDAREFPTRTGKANFATNPLEWVPVPAGRLVLQTLRSHDQYNTTIYGLDDRYRGVKGGRRVVFVNPADIESLGLKPGDRVDLVSEFAHADEGVQERRAKDFVVVAYSTPVGNAAAYYPETNPLVPLDHTAAKSNTPVSKAVVIRLEASGQDRGTGAAWGG
jgi:molybdopterin-dependent oxidoreductase alpha subunit